MKIFFIKAILFADKKNFVCSMKIATPDKNRDTRSMQMAQCEHEKRYLI